MAFAIWICRLAQTKHCADHSRLTSNVALRRSATRRATPSLSDARHPVPRIPPVPENLPGVGFFQADKASWTGWLNGAESFRHLMSMNRRMSRPHDTPERPRFGLMARVESRSCASCARDISASMHVSRSRRPASRDISASMHVKKIWPGASPETPGRALKRDRCPCSSCQLCVRRVAAGARGL